MDEEALLANMRKNPEDHLPYLVYADWLEEHGRVKEADLIRLSVASDYPAEHPYLRTKTPRLYRRRLIRELDSKACFAKKQVYCIRKFGVMKGLRIYLYSVNDIPSLFDLLAQHLSCHEVEIYFGEYNHRSRPLLSELTQSVLSKLITETRKRSQCPLRQIRSLTIRGFTSGLRKINHTDWIEAFPELRDLSIQFEPFRRTDLIFLRCLKDAAFQKNLKSIKIDGLVIDHKGMDILLTWPSLPRLESLTLIDNDLDEASLIKVCGTRFQNLKRLFISSNTLLEHTLELIPETFQNLDNIIIRSSQIPDESILRFHFNCLAGRLSKHIYWSSHFTRDFVDFMRRIFPQGQIEELNITSRDQEVEDWSYILDCEFLKNLKDLSILSYTFRDEDLLMIARHPHAANLEYLGICATLSYAATMEFYRIHPKGDTIRFDIGTGDWSADEIVRYLDEYANRFIPSNAVTCTLIFLGNAIPTGKDANRILEAVFRNLDRLPQNLDELHIFAKISDTTFGHLPLNPKFLQSDIYLNFNLAEVTIEGVKQFLSHPELRGWNGNSNILEHYGSDPEIIAMIKACPYIRFPVD
jgi:uncharacterized protein (TIGR02996 family)